MWVPVHKTHMQEIKKTFIQGKRKRWGYYY